MLMISLIVLSLLIPIYIFADKVGWTPEEYFEYAGKGPSVLSLYILLFPVLILNMFNAMEGTELLKLLQKEVSLGWAISVYLGGFFLHGLHIYCQCKIAETRKILEVCGTPDYLKQAPVIRDRNYMELTVFSGLYWPIMIPAEQVVSLIKYFKERNRK